MLVATAAAMLLAGLGQPTPGPGTNLLRNPGFEELLSILEKELGLTQSHEGKKECTKRKSE